MNNFFNFKLIATIIIFSSSLLIISCEKGFENIEENTQLIESNLKATNQTAGRTFYDNGKVPGVDGVDYGCKLPALNCGSSVTISSATSAAQICADIIDNHNNNTGGDVIVNDIILFKDNKEVLVRDLFSNEDVNKLISREYNLRIRGPKAVLSVKDGTNYYCFIGKGRVVSSYPIEFK